MNEIGLMLTISGMIGVFVVLSLLAFVMWAMGRVFRDNKAKNSEIIKSSDVFSEIELFAIAAAILQHESVKVPEVKTPENWKRYAKIYAVRWSE
ncbi:OadG family protein [Archaeoglobus sp.]